MKRCILVCAMTLACAIPALAQEFEPKTIPPETIPPETIPRFDLKTIRDSRPLPAFDATRTDAVGCAGCEVIDAKPVAAVARPPIRRAQEKTKAATSRAAKKRCEFEASAQSRAFTFSNQRLTVQVNTCSAAQ
ncbi:MAG: hypothetical protein GKR94_14190 [Gammaproteobacteria bacterium]|nr:hypothetical protein [Gammaproteobacteria bacterium]